LKIDLLVFILITITSAAGYVRLILADEQMLQRVTSVQQLEDMETELEQALERVHERKSYVMNSALYGRSASGIQRQVTHNFPFDIGSKKDL
jgi:hypothetical protein